MFARSNATNWAHGTGKPWTVLTAIVLSRSATVKERAVALSGSPRPSVVRSRRRGGYGLVVGSHMAPWRRCRVLLAMAVVLVAVCANTMVHSAPPNPAGCGLASSEVGRLATPAVDPVDLRLASSLPEPAIACWNVGLDPSPDAAQRWLDAPLVPRAPPSITTLIG